MPYLLTSQTYSARNITLWRWDQDWKEVGLKGHCGEIYRVVFHPTESHTFASTSEHKTIKIWDIEEECVAQTLRVYGMQSCRSIDFCSEPEKTLLVSGHDDGLVRVWDYEEGICTAKLQGHTDGVSTCFFHPHLPYILSASKNGEIRLWSDTDFQLASSYSCGLQNVVAGAPCKQSNMLVLGGGGGFLVLEIGTMGEQKKTEKFKVGEKRVRTEPLVSKGFEGSRRKAICPTEDIERKIGEEVARTVSKWKKKIDDVRTEEETNERIQLEAEMAQQQEEERQELSKQTSPEPEEERDSEANAHQLSDESRTKLLNRIRQLESERANFKQSIRELEDRLENAIAAREVREFSLNELKEATNNFDTTQKLNDGDCCCCVLGEKKECNNTLVRVKRLRHADMQAIEHSKFKTEIVDRLRKLQHPHLLTLVGVCYDSEEACLVYEHMANGSVKDCIARREGPSRGLVLPWRVRFRVMADVARAVSFLHSNS
ncbi:hypothetical protein CBR_g8704 [Chara braunii]|uniref:Protein kinase domain-containing protein n=1 Tax=Chara braunii TaxID=69332 RepID=A0A388KMK2_CHABU|nr:hypothetical protein CBR_g8704 [Chara braunii]|eukprot:GBG71282.1 hypothetical protein CBR_g8704 [Chara braunii]